jgi:GDPmannose 4,6-dehydratase
MTTRALITGITGQDGSYLAELLLEKGYEVYGIIRRASVISTSRIDHLLFPEEKIKLIYGDLGGDIESLIHDIKPDLIFNMASMSHVRVSFDIPIYTLDVNAIGPTRILEAVRNSGMKNKTRIYHASSSEQFGMSPPPQNELTPFHPCSPYGIAKLAAYWMTRTYRESYNMFVSNGILFNHECLFANTPLIVRQKDEIDIVYVSSLIQNRTDSSKNSNYEEKNYKGSGVQIWDGENFVDLLTVSRKKLHTLEKQNQQLQITNCRMGVVTSTPNHTFIKKNDEKIKAKECELNVTKLKKGKYPVGLDNKVCSEEFAELLGILCGDGYVPDCGTNYIRVAKESQVVLARATYLARKVFTDISIKINKFNGGYGLTTQLKISGLSRSEVMTLREMIYDAKTKHKKVPKLILNAGRSTKEAFFRGYYSTDGLKAAGGVSYAFTNFKSNSPLLAQGMLYIIADLTGQRFTINVEEKEGKFYYSINLNTPASTHKGNHLRKNRLLVKKIISKNVENQHVFDVETSSGKIMAGVGLTVIGNSPRRGETFVTKKIVRGAVRIKLGLQQNLVLGNLSAKRDWGHSRDYMDAVYAILTHSEPDDFVVATGVHRSILDFVQLVFESLDLDWQRYVQYDARYTRPKEVPELCGQPEKIQRVLHWEPKISVEMLAKEMIESVMREERHNARNST